MDHWHYRNVKQKKSRKTALHLLLTLCNFCPNNFQTVLDFLLNNHHSFNDGTNNQQYPRQDLVTEWQFDPQSKDKGVTGHVGMRNLGATCYLNSLLQQLFLIIPFRYGILTCSADQVSM